MKTFGFILDALIIGAVGYLAIQHPAVDTVKRVGFVNALASLPTPLNPRNATGFFIPEGKDAVITPIHLRAQEWFNYLLDEDVGSAAALRPDLYPELKDFQSVNKWKNSLILPQFMIDQLPHVLAIWMRNMFAGWLLYYTCGFAWALVMYKLCKRRFYKTDEDMPSWEDMRLQMGVSSKAMIFYTLAPTVGEWVIERGWTHTYHSLSKVAFSPSSAVGNWIMTTLAPALKLSASQASFVNGLLGYFAYLALYLVFVEWAIYWIHRLEHDVEWLYLTLHKPHHIYNNRNSLSPFAGLAFHPVDGLAQASPYIIGLFLLPVNFWTHEVLLFFTAVWTTNIHDTLTGDTEPIMGSAYHTIHHTTYKNNYGQIFVLFDWLHDTLAPPKHKREQWGWNTPTGRSYGVDYSKLGSKGVSESGAAVAEGKIKAQ